MALQKVVDALKDAEWVQADNVNKEALFNGELGKLEGVTIGVDQASKPDYVGIMHPDISKELMREELANLTKDSIAKQVAKLKGRVETEVNMGKYYGEFRTMGSSRMFGQFDVEKTKVIVIAGTMDELQTFSKSHKDLGTSRFKIGKKSYESDELWGFTTELRPENLDGIKIDKKVKIIWIGKFEFGTAFKSIVDRMVMACL